MRAAEARERRHEVHVAVVGHARGERFDIRRALDESEPIAQPLHGSARDEYAAFERVVRGIPLPRDGRDESMTRRERVLAGVHQQEAASAVSVLRHAWLEAALAEQRGLLIACDPRER